MADRKMLPVQYDDGRYFIDEAALNQHIENNLAELRETTLAATDISNKRLATVVVLAVSFTGMVAALAAAGSTFWAFVLAFLALVNVKPVLQFAEKSPK